MDGTIELADKLYFFLCFLCFAKVCCSHRLQVGTDRGLGALQHSMWPNIWMKALWVLGESMNFHPDKHFFNISYHLSLDKLEGSSIESREKIVCFLKFLLLFQNSSVELRLNEAKKNILALGQKQSEKSCRHISIIVRGGGAHSTAPCQASRILLIMLLEVAAEMTLLWGSFGCLLNWAQLLYKMKWLLPPFLCLWWIFDAYLQWAKVRETHKIKVPW